MAGGRLLAGTRTLPVHTSPAATTARISEATSALPTSSTKRAGAEGTKRLLLGTGLPGPEGAWVWELHSKRVPSSVSTSKNVVSAKRKCR